MVAKKGSANPTAIDKKSGELASTEGSGGEGVFSNASDEVKSITGVSSGSDSGSDENSSSEDGASSAKESDFAPMEIDEEGESALLQQVQKTVKANRKDYYSSAKEREKIMIETLEEVVKRVEGAYQSHSEKIAATGNSTVVSILFGTRNRKCKASYRIVR